MPKPTTKPEIALLTIAVPLWLRTEVGVIAARRNMFLRDVVIEALTRHLRLTEPGKKAS